MSEEAEFSLPRFRVPVCRKVSNWELGEVIVRAPDDAAALAMVADMDDGDIDDLVTTETHTLEDEGDSNWEPDPDREVTCIEPGGYDRLPLEDTTWTFSGIKEWADQLKAGMIPRELAGWVNPLRVLDEQTTCRRGAAYLASILAQGQWPYVDSHELFALRGQLDRLQRRGFRVPAPAL